MTTKFKIFVFILSTFLSDNSSFAQQDDSCFCQAVRSQDVSLVENIGCADKRLSMLKLLTLHKMGRNEESERQLWEIFDEEDLIRLDKDQLHETYQSCLNYAEAAVKEEVAKKCTGTTKGMGDQTQVSEDSNVHANRFYEYLLHGVVYAKSHQTVISDSLRKIAIECESAFSWYFGDKRFLKLGIYAYHSIGNMEDVSRLMPMLGDDEALSAIIESIDKTLGK